jgi:phosphate transport system protein
MTQLENEIAALKAEIVAMWMLVQSQMNNAKAAMVTFDKDLAREVLVKEKRVNSFELKIDRDCENILALNQPVAVDLRFLLAALKINSNLERIGDIAAGIAHYIIESPVNFEVTFLESSSLIRMYDEAVNILTDTRTAFEQEDSVMARSIFKRDDLLNQINMAAPANIAESIKADISIVNEAMYILSIIRKLERVGDHAMNIAEEIIFYVEAKVLKHAGKEKKAEA